MKKAETIAALLQDARKALFDADIELSALDARLLFQAASGLTHEELIAEPNLVLADDKISKRSEIGELHRQALDDSLMALQENVRATSTIARMVSASHREIETSDTPSIDLTLKSQSATDRIQDRDSILRALANKAPSSELKRIRKAYDFLIQGEKGNNRDQVSVAFNAAAALLQPGHHRV